MEHRTDGIAQEARRTVIFKLEFPVTQSWKLHGGREMEEAISSEYREKIAAGAVKVWEATAADV